MFGFRTVAVEFDDAAVTGPIAKAEARTVRIVGYETRREAMNSIRPGRGSSRPGEPPHDQTGIYKRFIRYAADATGKLVVIGPEYLPRKSKDVPAALERGGVSITAQGTTIRVEPRPVMRPALARTIQQALPKALADSVHA